MSRDGAAGAATGHEAQEWFEDTCWVCGVHGRFVGVLRPGRPMFRCSSCRSPMRYQAQALALVRRYSLHGSASFAELAGEPEFRALRVYEPGTKGPFRKALRGRPGYEVSTYQPGVGRGETRDGTRNEDLMDLTYPAEAFDLVITTDVFEHIRRPYEAFAELHRVLRPGGAHVFTVPVRWPLRSRTRRRVDVDGDEDVFLLELRYHNGNLVYNDFGRDMLDRLDQIGFDTEVIRLPSTLAAATRMLSFCSVTRG